MYMSKDKKCVVCGNEVNWDNVLGEFEHKFEQVDNYGLETLSEKDQLIVDGRVCTRKCYKFIS